MSLHSETISVANPVATLVLLHGYGSNELDLLGLGQELELPFEVISFRAPRSLGGGSFAWYDLQFDAFGNREYSAEQALAARDMVVSELSTLRATRPCLILGGFSQGSITSLGVGLARPDLVDGLWLMSGALNPEFLPDSVSSAFVGLPKLVQHGVQDPVLPVRHGREIRDFLASTGAAGEYLEYPMAHQISMASLRDAQRVLSGWSVRDDRVEDLDHRL